MKFPRRQFLHLAAGAAVLPAISRVAMAQAYPTRPVRFIVPFAAGGGLDYAARTVGGFVSHEFGQPVIVENKPGAGGLIGTETAAKSAPDGYTVLITTDALASVPPVTNFDTDYVKDLVPVIQLTGNPVILAVHSMLDVRSIDELIRAAKQQPGMGYATSGVGTEQHFAGEWFAQIAGIKLQHVPYRGAGQAINDLIAGHVKLAILGPLSLLPHYKAGTLRLLAQSSATRSSTLPEVPTFKETGITDLVIDLWTGAFVPARTSPTIITRLHAELGKALADAATREGLLQASMEPIGGSPEQFARHVRTDTEKYARLAIDLKIKAE
jgi:tripartite-type tricarboxylate transporter receptor subunit TctC